MHIMMRRRPPSPPPICFLDALSASAYGFVPSQSRNGLLAGLSASPATTVVADNASDIDGIRIIGVLDYAAKHGETPP